MKIHLKRWYYFNSKCKVSGRKVTVKVGDVDGERGKTLIINTKVGKLANEVYKKEVTITSNIKADNTEQRTLMIYQLQ